MDIYKKLINDQTVNIFIFLQVKKVMNKKSILINTITGPSVYSVIEFTI